MSQWKFVDVCCCDYATPSSRNRNGKSMNINIGCILIAEFLQLKCDLIFVWHSTLNEQSKMRAVKCNRRRFITQWNRSTSWRSEIEVHRNKRKTFVKKTLVLKAWVERRIEALQCLFVIQIVYHFSFSCINLSFRNETAHENQKLFPSICPFLDRQFQKRHRENFLSIAAWERFAHTHTFIQSECASPQATLDNWLFQSNSEAALVPRNLFNIHNIFS